MCIIEIKIASGKVLGKNELWHKGGSSLKGFPRDLIF
jgi:hypothetical protein